jgi:purine-nucleoside phosphorylase
VIVAESAIREDGTSYHYLEDEEDHVESDWLNEWSFVKGDFGFRSGPVWTCDAIYRETENKVSRYAQAGVFGVEMEVASFYAACRYKHVKGIAFLVISDTLYGRVWKSGFHTKPFKEGVKRLTSFLLEHVIK